MKKFKKFSSLKTVIISVAVAFCLAFSAILISTQRNLSSSRLTAQAEAIRMSSFTDKSSYSLTSSTQDFTVKPYSLTDLVDARTLENTDTTGAVNSALTTKDLIWLPSYEGTEINASNYSTKADPTGINTMIYNINDNQASNSTRRLSTPTDYAVANNPNVNYSFHSTLSETQGTTWYWLRSPNSNTYVYYVYYNGNVTYTGPTYDFMAARPALQFNLESIISARSALNVQIDTSNKTITVPNIMYPQTRVPEGSILETNLNNAYNSGTLQNGMTATGTVYKGMNDSPEYLFNGNYYTRTKVSKNNASNIFSDGSTTANNNYIWIKVEPITWYITNWANMPKSINPQSTTSTPDSEIIVLSQYAIVNIGQYYSTYNVTGSTLWQNSRFRAYLNGYDLAEQNNGANGSNDAAYLAPIQANFKNNGFAQTVWHDLKPSLISKATLANNGFDSDNNALDSSTLNTTDLVWLPSTISGDPTNINTMITNVFGTSNNQNRLSTPSDYAVANNTSINYSYHSTLSETQGTTWYWLRSPYSSPNVYSVYTYGYVTNTTPAPYGMAARPALQFNVGSIISARSALNVQIDTSNKTITVPNIMYPQTRVAEGSTLETTLNNAYNSGTLQNGMTATGTVYKGMNDSPEYLFDGNYYTRTKVSKNNASNIFSDGSTTANNNYIWIKVEPITWYITNWNNMPISINPNGDETATEIIVLSQYSIVSVGAYYPNTSNDYRTMWQNSNYRAYLNGYDLWDENTYGNGNTNYKAATQANFKGSGFIDTIWHETTTALITPTTLQNNGFNSDGSAINTATNNLTTTDLVWIPTFEGVGITASNYATKADPTGISTMVYNAGISMESTPSDYVVANNAGVNYGYHSTLSDTQGTVEQWCRLAGSVAVVYYIRFGGGVGSINPGNNYAVRPALQFNLQSIISARSALGITIDASTKSIVIPSIMYPQTRVTAGSTLETQLNNAYNSGTLQNGMIATGRVYAGYNTTDGSGSATNDSYEYLFGGYYYTRTRVQKRNTANVFLDGSTADDGTYIWIKVEPITWLITNWNTLPASFTGETTGGTDTEIIVLSQYAIVQTGSYYSTYNGSTMWQNSIIRAYLNGYDLSEQNTGLNGNATYKSSIQANFKGHGFIDTIWHDLSEVSLVDILGKTDLNNTIFMSETDTVSNETTKTSDYVYVPTKTELESYLSSREKRIITPTDYALANKANLNTKYHSTFDLTQGSTQYWLRSPGSNNIINYVDYLGNYASTSTRHSHYASLLALNFDVEALIAAKDKINFEVDSTNKIIILKNLMYPQTKVETGSELESNLNSAYSSPTVTNSLSSTGRVYAGLTTWEGTTQNTAYNYEYFYKGEYYVRALVTLYNSSYAFSDGTSTANGTYAWFKVEPVVWNITNWEDLPSDLTNGQTSGSATTLSAMSKYAIVCVGDYYPNTTDDYRTAWQNSALRAFLNGFDLDEQISDLSNGSVTYKSAILANFKGLGFVDTCWHAYLPNNN